MEKIKSKKTGSLIFIFTFYLFTFTFLLSVNADTVYMASGNEIKGLVVEEHKDRIVLSTYEGEKTILKNDIDQIFFDNQDQNYVYLAEQALQDDNLELAKAFYQKAYQINPESSFVNSSFPRLADVIARQRLKIGKGESLDKLKVQLGLGVDRHKDKIRVLEVKKKSPAQYAGIKKDDFIVEAWGRSLMFIDSPDASFIMIGVPSTALKIAIEKNIVISINPACWFSRVFSCMRYINSGFKISLKPEGLVVDSVKRIELIKSGLEAKDVITHINGESTRYMPLALARKKIFNNSKEVILTVRRQVVLIRGGL